MTLILNSLFSFFFPSCRVEFFLISFFFFLKEIYFPFPFLGNVKSNFFFFDNLSVIMVMLSCWIIIAMMMSLKEKKEKKSEIPIIITFLNLCLFFFVSNKIFFFIFFESSLFPIFFLMMKWGSQPERLKAVFFFLIYTVFFSTPFLISLLFLKSEVFFFPSSKMSETWSFFLLFVLMVKLPLFFIHFWLPKAHVEAPVIGSMILAGVLLKMGGYGIFRIFFFLKKNSKVSFFFFSFALIGALIISIICLFCQDMKQLIAYSSISHMNFMIFGMMEGSSASMKASFMVMVIHGLSSSCFFFLADTLYKRTFSRSLFISKGLMNIFPLSAMWFFLNVMISSGVPPTLGSFCELLIFSSIFFKFFLSFFFIILYAFFSLFYLIYFYYNLMHGNFKKKSFFFPFTVKENFILFLHHFLIWNLIFFSDFF